MGSKALNSARAKDTSTSRREAITKGSAIALGVAAGILGTRQPAAAEGTFKNTSTTFDPAIWGENVEIALPGEGGAGVEGTSANGYGVFGSSETSAGVRGIHTSPTEAVGAVVGVNNGAGAGVVGRAGNGPGIRGIAPRANPGVFAQSGSQRGSITLDDGIALLALGHTVIRPPTDADLAPGDSLSIDPSVDAPRLDVQGNTQFPAIKGQNTNPFAAPGDGGPGVQGSSPSGFGVHGISDTSNGVQGVHTSATLAGHGISGVNGGAGTGVAGRAVHGAGVRGSAPGTNPAVLARSADTTSDGRVFFDFGLALLAIGKTILRPPKGTDGDGLAAGAAPSGQTLEVTGGARTDGLFMPIGTGLVAAGMSVAQVTDPASGLSSHIAVTLVSAPQKKGHEPSTAVSWVERASGSFTVHLTEAVDSNTPFTYIVANP